MSSKVKFSTFKPTIKVKKPTKSHDTTVTRDDDYDHEEHYRYRYDTTTAVSECYYCSGEDCGDECVNMSR